MTHTTSTSDDLDAPHLDAKTRKRLADCIAISRDRNAARATISVAIAPPTDSEIESGVSRPITRSRGRSGTPAPKVIAEAHDRLDIMLRQRGMEPFPLFPTSEYPTPLTRLPLFPPVKKCTARQIAASGDWVALTSRWDGGGVFKSGPPLTVFDEDTLFGLMTLRQQ